MSDKQTTNTNYISSGAVSAIEAASENIILRIINKGIEFVDTQNKQLSIQTGEAFKTYLDKAYLRLNQMRTLATGYDTVSIIGEDSIYVETSVLYESVRGNVVRKFDVISIEDLLTLDNNNILITGTGGAGKTMLMKYLFLNTKNRGKYIPVFLELRKIEKKKDSKISIEDLIYSCMESYDVAMTRDMLDYSLRYGGYVFLFDGYDEITDAYADEAAEAIQQFCSKYDKNIYIVTSRENNSLMALFQTFSVVNTLPLNLDKAKQMIQRLGGDLESNQAFCLELEKSLYGKYEDFAGNPLLLTMMYLVYIRNGSVPDYLVDFYGQCFDALYSRHDSYHKGNYKREFKCKHLPEHDFKQIFSKFCFVTYFKSQYEFKKSEMLTLLQICIKKSTDREITAEDFLTDLQDAVCLVIKDGEVYRFVHRNFQTYFAALHVDGMNDKEQKQLAEMDLNKKSSHPIYYVSNLFAFGDFHIERFDFYKLLYQINPERFLQNLIYPVLREFMKKVNDSENPDKALLIKLYASVTAFGDIDTGYEFQESDSVIYYKVIALFELLVTRIHRSNLGAVSDSYVNVVTEMSKRINCEAPISSDTDVYVRMHYGAEDILFSDIERYLEEEPEDRAFSYLAQHFYDEVCRAHDIMGMRKILNDWIDQQEQKHKKVESANDFESLVDSLI